LLSDGRILRRLIVALTFVAGIAMVLMMLHIVVDVIGRMVFSRPLNGTTEIVSGYYMVAVIFFPLAYVTRYEGHITVELFTRKLPPRQFAWLEVVVGMVCLGFLAWFTWESGVSAYNSLVQKEQWETAADLVTIWPSRWILPIGLTLMGVYMTLRVIDDLRNALSSK
jgi:TRAP-type C4-dicarboxylate transport system permease small subunit